MQATTDSAASGSIDLAAGDARIRRRDFLVSPSGAPRRGIVAGTVTDAAGIPLGGARITMDGIPKLVRAVTVDSFFGMCRPAHDNSR